MKIEKQVCNIKSSKKLEKLGIKQDSFFYWYKLKGKWILFRGIDLGLPEFKSEKGEKIYSAFTPAELGEKLPSRVNNKNVVFGKIGKNYEIYLHRKDEDIVQNEYFREKTEANARAKMLIYLKENKLI